MWADVLDAVLVVCTVVGALTIWALITAPIFIRIMRRTRHLPLEPPVTTAPVTTADPAARRATSWSAVPSWVKHDREWAAAVVLLGSDPIADRTTPFVDFPARRIDWLGLRLAAADWPAHDKLLVEVAYDLAYGQHEPTDGTMRAPVTVADLAERLDASELDLVHEAVTVRRGE